MAPRSYRQYCSLARALDVVGDRWSMLIVRNLLLGPQRWSALRDNLPGIAKNLLSSRLKQLEADGVLSSDGGQYALTERGLALQPMLFSLATWGEEHFMGPPGEEDAFRLRYLMTSMRRKLRPTEQCGTVQLHIGDQFFAVHLGPIPQVVQGTIGADAGLSCGLQAFRALLFGGADLASLQHAGQATITGDAALVQVLVDAWPRLS